MGKSDGSRGVRDAYMHMHMQHAHVHVHVVTLVARVCVRARVSVPWVVAPPSRGGSGVGSAAGRVRPRCSAQIIRAFEYSFEDEFDYF